MSLHVFRAVALKVMWATAQKGFGYQVAKIIAIYYGCMYRKKYFYPRDSLNHYFSTVLNYTNTATGESYFCRCF